MKKFLALVLVFVLSLGTVAFAADFKDMPDDWSTSALEAAVANGLLGGNGGYIYPSDNMTRAEMATIMVRACGAIDEANISGYTDVKPEDWFYASMAKAVAMGAFTGSDNKLNPESPITRQEAFLVLSRVFGLYADKDDLKAIDAFKDGEKVAEWAKEGVAAIISSGYVAGADGYLNPLNNISRAEFAVVMDRLVKYYIDDAAAEIPTDGNVMIRVPGVALDKLETSNVVILGDGMGKEDITIADANMTGKLVVRAGKKVSVSGNLGGVSIAASGITLEGDPHKIKHIHVCKGSTFSAPLIMLTEPSEK
ncbi:MAG: S-layer homology domain-containing protein [Clostridia bacterium]|nr:S-layer homology domain-containing protein [Clostridia bacterium]